MALPRQRRRPSLSEPEPCCIRCQWLSMSSNPVIILVLVVGLAAFASFVLGWVSAEIFRVWRFGLWPRKKEAKVRVWDNPRSRRNLLHKPGTKLAVGLFAAIAAGLICYFMLLRFSPWPPLVIIRHMASAPNCDAARASGLAPAKRGEPGYWQRHDEDNDGTACEPQPIQ